MENISNALRFADEVRAEIKVARAGHHIEVMQANILPVVQAIVSGDDHIDEETADADVVESGDGHVNEGAGFENAIVLFDSAPSHGASGDSLTIADASQALENLTTPRSKKSRADSSKSSAPRLRRRVR